MLSEEEVPLHKFIKMVGSVFVKLSNLPPLASGNKALVDDIRASHKDVQFSFDPRTQTATLAYPNGVNAGAMAKLFHHKMYNGSVIIATGKEEEEEEEELQPFQKKLLKTREENAKKRKERDEFNEKLYNGVRSLGIEMAERNDGTACIKMPLTNFDYHFEDKTTVMDEPGLSFKMRKTEMDVVFELQILLPKEK